MIPEKELITSEPMGRVAVEDRTTPLSVRSSPKAPCTIIADT